MHISYLVYAIFVLASWMDCDDDDDDDGDERDRYKQHANAQKDLQLQR